MRRSKYAKLLAERVDEHATGERDTLFAGGALSSTVTS
jgi:hypothetical protein